LITIKTAERIWYRFRINKDEFHFSLNFNIKNIANEKHRKKVLKNRMLAHRLDIDDQTKTL
jgi:hypothetical protein